MPQKSSSFVRSLLGYPKAVYFILGNEFCERFSFYGLRAVLTLYLINEHGFEESKAFFFYHAFISFVYFTPLIGSILADNYLGRFKVIVLGSIIYIVGLISLSIGSINLINMPIRSTLGFVGLAIIALATGGIKPCVSSFAADQFDESREADRAQFFSFFYFAINFGALISMFLTPVLRGRVQCFGSEYCFPLSFGVPSIFMLIATVIFLFGHRYYQIQPANKGNVIGKVVKCIIESIYAKFNGVKIEDSNVRRGDWLDYAPVKYDNSLVAAVRSFTKVLIILLPLPFYHALADQQGSTWVVQARELDGNVNGWVTLLPDQLNAFNSVFVILAIFVYESALFPIAYKFLKITPLQKMCTGGIITGIAYVIGGILQLQINKTLAPIPSPNHSFLYRTGNSTARMWSKNGPYMLVFEKNEWPSSYGQFIDENGQEFNLTFVEKNSYVIGIYGDNKNSRLNSFHYNSTKPPNGKTRIYLSIDPKSSLINQKIYILGNNNQIVAENRISPGVFFDILPSTFGSNEYTIAYGKNCEAKNCPFQIQLIAQMGAVHLLEMTDDFFEHLQRKNELKLLIQPNTINILWQLPQILVISFGEVLICVTALEFVYSQAAPSMKSVLQAAWLMTSFLGNLIDMGISGTHMIKEPATEMFFYAILMFVVMAIFVYLSTQYQYVNPADFKVTNTKLDSGPKVKWSLDSIGREEDAESLSDRRIERGNGRISHFGRHINSE